MGSSSEIIEIDTCSRSISVDNGISLNYYFRIADNILNSLALDTIPSHRDYRTSPKRKMEYLRMGVLDALTELEKLKPIVLKKIDELNNRSTVTNVTRAFSGTSIVRYRGGIGSGIPKKCWCGASIIDKISKSKNNSYRRYYRCGFAISHKLVDDNHIFKWVDEAIVNEVETFFNSLEELEKSIMEIKNNTFKQLEIKFQRLQMNMENEVLEKVVVVFSESERRMRKLMVIALILSMISIRIMKLSD